MTSLEKDTLSRNRIVSEINENFFVEAGAGSGKTTMLVNRMAAMVEAGIEISKICAITFTKAAAGEFYDRFQRLLIERSNPEYKGDGGSGDAAGRPGMLPMPTDETRERCREALQNIDLCFMGTIDSFCGMVLSEHPSEAGIPSDASIVSDEDAATVYKQQYVKICGGEYGEELQSLARTFQALHSGAQDIFVQGISFVMNNRNVHFNYHEAAAVDIDRDFAADRTELIRAVKCLMAHPELKYGGNKESREAWDKIGNIYKNIRGRWSNNYTNLMYGIKDLKGIRLIPEAMNYHAVSLGSVFAPGGKKGQWLECTAGQAGGLLEKLQKLQYDASMTFLIRSIPVMEQALREKGSLTFFDYLYYLRNMLKRDAEADGKLIRYIYDRHSYFLIDEFQDTNPMQAEVFFYLTSEHPVPQWSACRPRPGSLFIVGDPKQSIYRFRSADVTSFLKVKKLFEENGGSILSLSRNFRSTRTLCEYFNRVFTELLPEETENQSKFEDIPLPEPVEDEFQGIFTYKAYTGQAEAEYPDMTDPVRIADLIEKIVGNGKFLIRGEKDKELRQVRCSDIMVITSSKKKLGPIMEELDARNIPARVEGAVPFAANQALYELSLIYSAVADADDCIALYGALTGSLIALTREDILRFKACGGSVSLKTALDREDCDDEADEAAQRTAAEIDRLKDLHTMALRLSPAALFSRIMDQYRLYRTVPAENLEVVYYALELIRNAEKSGLVISLKDGAAFIKGLIAGESGEERCLSLTADKDCVHMANLHKVKGLEAPIVILAAAGSKSFPGSYRMIHTEKGSEGYIFSLESEQDEKGRSKIYFSTADYSDEKAEETEALRAEGQRLVYVAATRARNVLILCNSVRISRGRETTNSKWAPIMETGLPDIFEMTGDSSGCSAQNGAKADAAGLYEAAEQAAVLNDRSAEKPTFKVENPSRLHVLSKLSESPEADGWEEAAEFPGAGRWGEAEESPEAGRWGEAAISPEADGREDLSESPEAGGAGDHWGSPAGPWEGKESTYGGRRFAALLGTMTHKLMEMLVTTRNTLDIEAAVGEIIREYSTPGTKGCESELAETLLRAADRIRKGGYVQTNGLPQDILGTLLAADEVYCEVPFCYKDGCNKDECYKDEREKDGFYKDEREKEGFYKDECEKDDCSRDESEGTTVWNGVMDVIYSSAGQWHIVDYKTNADGNDLDTRYQAQLSAYVKAFKATTGLDADAMTYHIDI